MERCELIPTVAALALLAFALVRLAWPDIENLVRAVRGRTHALWRGYPNQKEVKAMYKWVIPPEMLSRLWHVKQRTGVPIARQIRQAVQAYLGQVEGGPAAASETVQPRTGGESS